MLILWWFIIVKIQCAMPGWFNIFSIPDCTLGAIQWLRWQTGLVGGSLKSQFASTWRVRNVNVEVVSWSNIVNVVSKRPSILIQIRSLLNQGRNTRFWLFSLRGTLLTLRGHSITTWTRWGEVVKKCLFLSTLRVLIKTVHAGGQTMAKFCPRSCWMLP